jgi:5-methylcytosine-specific restriction endonuclease McrA
MPDQYIQMSMVAPPTDGQRCRTCGLTKPLHSFRPEPRMDSGLRSDCRNCENERKQIRVRYEREHPEVVPEHIREERRLRNRESQRKYRERQPKRVQGNRREYNRTWKQKNREHIRDYNYRYWLAHKDDCSKSDKERRRKIRLGRSEESVLWWRTIRNDPCSYCGCAGKMTVDHIVPINSGGSHQWDNLAPACLSCNSRKQDRLLIEFLLHS